MPDNAATLKLSPRRPDGGIILPSADTLRDRARAIAATLSGRIDDANRRRDIDPEVIASLREADLFRLFRPRRFGGYETDPRLFYDIQNILAEQCLSTAWVFGVLSIQAFVLALFDPAAHDDVWGADESALVSSSFKPEGTVVTVEGGYRISGQWSFSSGSSHAGWALVGGLAPPATAGEPPHMRLFLVPRTDYEIIDTWNTFGLRGTGSNDLRLEDVFVPVHRTWKPTPGVTIDTTADCAPLFRLPWLFMFPSCIANLAVGGGRAAVKRLSRMVATMPAASTDPVKRAIGRAHREIEAANSLLQANIGHMLSCARDGTALPFTEALLCRSQLTSMLRTITQQVDTLMLLTGGRGIHEDGPLTQIWLDLNAARHHPGNLPDPADQALAENLIAG